MTARELRDEIATIDGQLRELVPWEAQLAAGRKQRLLEATREAREELAVIDYGVRGGQGRPNDPLFEPFDHGRPGLIQARAIIADLRERRQALQDALPSDAQQAACSREAEEHADEIRALAATLDTQTAEAVAALNEATRLALVVAQQTRTLWEQNTALDKLTRDEALARPETPRRDALTYPLAAPLGRLLVGYLMGGPPHDVETLLVTDIERHTHG